VVANAGPKVNETVARVTEAGATSAQIHPLSLIYPPEVFSLSHVAIPFPMNDALYGMRPDDQTDEEFGVNLGAMAARGEVGLLIVTLDSLIRASSNPFFPYMLDRIADYTPEPPGSADAGTKR